MPERDYVPSTFKIKCLCGNFVTVRTKEREHTEPCWKCGIRTIKVVMGYGVGNYRCAVVENATRKETTVKPINVDQGGRA